MSKKKITFPTTPNRGNLVDAIDNWVIGEKKSTTPSSRTKQLKSRPTRERHSKFLLIFIKS